MYYLVATKQYDDQSIYEECSIWTTKDRAELVGRHAKLWNYTYDIIPVETIYGMNMYEDSDIIISILTSMTINSDDDEIKSLLNGLDEVELAQGNEKIERLLKRVKGQYDKDK